VHGDFDFDDLDLPPLNIDFNINVPSIPEIVLQLQFDGLELYVELDTTFSGELTYNLNLYTSETPIGFSIGDDLFLGVVVDVDLILSADANITISSGFHILLDDGAQLEIPLFSNSSADIRMTL